MATLREIVLEICTRAGLEESQVDVEQLPDVEVDGFHFTNQYPVSQAILALAQVYHFDAATYDRQVHFIPRGANSVATVTEDDMVEDEQQEEESRRIDAINVPRVLHLNYYDVDSGGLNTLKQSSERAGDRRAVGEMSLTSGVVMNADLAARTVVVAHKVMVEDQKGEVNVSLPDNWLFLVASDPMIVQRRGRSERCRIHREDIDDGLQNYTLLRDRQSAYTSAVEGIPPPTLPAPRTDVIGPTVLAVLDIPLLQDADDNAGLGFYVAIAGFTEGWAGATVELSYDGGANYVRGRTSDVAAVIGILTSPLPDHPLEYPDQVNTFSVDLAGENDELVASTLEGMLNGDNLAAVGNHTDGWEIINFADAEQSTDGSWTIGHLLRGRKHTGSRSHADGDYFVLLNRGLIAFEPASLTDLGRTITFRATSVGEPLSSATVDVVFSGLTQIEYPVGYLHGTIEADELTLTWQGAGRLGAGTNVEHGAKFLGYTVTLYDDAAGEIIVETTEEQLVQDVSSLTRPVHAFVQARNELTGLGQQATEIIIP